HQHGDDVLKCMRVVVMQYDVVERRLACLRRRDQNLSAGITFRWTLLRHAREPDSTRLTHSMIAGPSRLSIWKDLFTAETRRRGERREERELLSFSFSASPR